MIFNFEEIDEESMEELRKQFTDEEICKLLNNKIQQNDKICT